jgi:thiol-disulfide isomerase/thioredoxin
VEAPHLTALYKKYHDKGFEILAVNSWDEPQDKVQGFVDDQKLTHPIALMGSRPAKQQYGVEGVPTNFWLDRQGNLVGREVGWRGAEHLEAELKKLLSEGS